MLRQHDFVGLLGPGNPLDASLRAIREHMTRTRGESAGEPYPLLIVRPDGAESYALARAAMRAWDDEFGYELVDHKMPLEFFEPDPALRQMINKAVKDARSRQSILAAAMPSKFGKDSEVGFVASPGRGGFVPASKESQNWLSRRGGFGTGDDTRYADGGRSSQAHDERRVPEVQSIGGPIEDGHSDGVAQAQRGNGGCSLADKRGHNWGLPQSNSGLTAVQRPIRLACLADRYVILPDKGQWSSPIVVLVEGSPVDEVDSLVKRIHQVIEGWGIAVAGGYWKPVLHVDVAQGGQERFEELRILLQDSGLEVVRKGK